MKVLALRPDGRVEYCICTPDGCGKRACNHVLHQGPEESNEEFIARAAPNENVAEGIVDLNESIGGQDEVSQDGLIMVELMNLLNYFDGSDVEMVEKYLSKNPISGAYELKPDFRVERSAEIEFIINSRIGGGKDSIVGLYGPRAMAAARYCIDVGVLPDSFFIGAPLYGCIDVPSIKKRLNELKG